MGLSGDWALIITSQEATPYLWRQQSFFQQNCLQHDEMEQTGHLLNRQTGSKTCSRHGELR